METILSQRIKNLVYFFVLGLLIVSVILAQLFFSPEKTINRMPSLSGGRVDQIEATIEQKIQKLIRRADFIFRSYRTGALAHSSLKNRESLIVENAGVIGEYYGEIYYFKFKPIPVSSWLLIEKNRDVYFVQRCDRNVYYVRFFFNLQDNVFFGRLGIPFVEAEFNFFDNPVPSREDQFLSDALKERFFFSRIMGSLNNQVVLHMKWLKTDVLSHSRDRRDHFVLLGTLLFFLVNIWYFHGRPQRKYRVLMLVSVVAVFLNGAILVSRLSRGYLDLKFLVFRFDSIYEVAVAMVFFWVVFLFFLKRFRKVLQNTIVRLVLFNLFVLGAIKTAQTLLSSLNFLYSEFNFNPEYLVLLLVFMVLHALPVYCMADFTVNKTISGVLGVLFFQVLAGLTLVLAFKIGVIHVLAFTLVLVCVLFVRRLPLTGFLVLLLIAISVFQLNYGSALREKREFVSNNLRKIFLNQGNYAKFIAREIVHELNRYKDEFPDFFQGDWSSRLESIWRRSIASRENIASGIFVISEKGELQSYYSYMVPFFKAKEYKTFPLWAIEDTTAEVYGKKLSLAVASTSVFQGYDFLGRIIVQVLNSPELILRSHEGVNIFTMNRKIRGSDLSYISLNEKNQILENPANVNLKNVAGIIKYHNQWIRFGFMDLDFDGYIFKQNRNSIVIFFPRPTMVKNMSELIRIFLLYALFFMVFRIRSIKNIQWKKLYFSFFTRVFAILILISLLTAVIFSVFSTDFFSRSSEIQMRQAFFDRGRTALNIGNNFIEESGELTLNQLFLLASMLNKDVSVYQGGELLFTSNYRKIIQSRIPVFLHSNIVDLLFKKNQKFVLEKEDYGFALFFKTYDYIFNIEFPLSRGNFISETSQYYNFIIVLFFFLLIIGVFSAFIFSNKIMSPVRELNRGMVEVEKGNLMHLRDIPPEIELKNLYLGFNAMVDGIKEQKKNISEISRMKTLLKMGRRVAHEVKNPLTPIKLSAEQILRSLRDKRKGYEKLIEKSVNFIIDESEHLKKVSYGFLDFSRLDELEVGEFNIRVAVEEEMISLKSLYPSIVFEMRQKGRDFTVRMDKLKIKQAVKNILINSIEAIGEKKGKIIITVSDKGKQVLVEISDNGVGLDQEELEFIFDEDYSTKEIGTGLGLFIVKRIIELHQGRVDIQSLKNRGTRVILNLPKDVSKTK